MSRFFGNLTRGTPAVMLARSCSFGKAAASLSSSSSSSSSSLHRARALTRPPRINMNTNTCSFQQPSVLLPFSISGISMMGARCISSYRRRASFTRRSPPQAPMTPSAHQKAPLATHVIAYTEDPSISAVSGVSKFLQKVYLYSGVGIMGSIATSTMLASYTSISHHPIAALVFGSIGMIASSLAMPYTDYTIVERTNTRTNKMELLSVPSTARLMCYGSLISCTGIMLTPMITYILALNPWIIPTSLLFTGSITMGAAYYAMKNPGSLMGYTPALYGALYGFVGMALVSMGSGFLFGWDNFLSSMWFRVDPYLGVLLFTGLFAHDTQLAAQSYELGDPDHIGCAVSLYLDAVNILIRIMEILSRFSRND